MEERRGEIIKPRMIKNQCKQVSKVDSRNSFLGILKIELVALNSISLEKSSILQEKHFFSSLKHC